MQAKNMKQINSMLMRELRKAMNITANKVLSDMYDETGRFYDTKPPAIYERTGALGDTPRITTLTTMGNSVSFDAYLDTNHVYTTGKNPTMTDILNLTKEQPVYNSSVGYLRAAIGNGGFWERANRSMEHRLDDTLKSFFK